MSNLNVVSKIEDNYMGMAAYVVGEKGFRPWGVYEVIGVGTNAQGEEYCEKEITVHPGQILSLQSHEYRREVWTVKKGRLEVVLNGKKHSLIAGDTIEIPLHAIHCMANPSQMTDTVVYERQIGMCREDDIIRYIDAYGRAPQSTDAEIKASIDLYNEIKEAIKI